MWKPFGSLWEASGKLLRASGSLLEAFGSLWKASRRLWEASGKLLMALGLALNPGEMQVYGLDPTPSKNAGFGPLAGHLEITALLRIKYTYDI